MRHRCAQILGPAVVTGAATLALLIAGPMFHPVTGSLGLTAQAWAEDHGGGHVDGGHTDGGHSGGGHVSGGGAYGPGGGPGGAGLHTGGKGGAKGQSGGHDIAEKVFRQPGPDAAGKHMGSGAGGAGKGLEDKIFRGEGQGGPGEDSDSDRPDWAGGGGKPGTGQPPGAGTKKGDLFGDMWVILRNPDGTPILTEDGFVQPLDKDGNLVPLDEEGKPLDESLVVEVELGRMSVARAPSKVLDRAFDDAMATIAMDADGILEYDAAGRILVVDADGVVYRIDSPLANLALYEAALSGTGDWTLAQAAAFLGTAVDKEGEILVDTVAYMNAILGIEGTITGDDGNLYYDYSTVTYDRATTYTGTIEYAELVVDPNTGDTTVVIKTDTILNAVFDGENATGTSIDGFALAADDARTVIDFLHEHQLPAS